MFLPNVIIGLHYVQAVVAWVFTQAWPPDQARQVIDQMRRAKRGDSAIRANRGAGVAGARGGDGRRQHNGFLCRCVHPLATPLERHRLVQHSGFDVPLRSVGQSCPFFVRLCPHRVVIFHPNCLAIRRTYHFSRFRLSVGLSRLLRRARSAALESMMRTEISSLRRSQRIRRRGHLAGHHKSEPPIFQCPFVLVMM